MSQSPLYLLKSHGKVLPLPMNRNKCSTPLKNQVTLCNLSCCLITLKTLLLTFLELHKRLTNLWCLVSLDWSNENLVQIYDSRRELYCTRGECSGPNSANPYSSLSLAFSDSLSQSEKLILQHLHSLTDVNFSVYCCLSIYKTPVRRLSAFEVISATEPAKMWGKTDLLTVRDSTCQVWEKKSFNNKAVLKPATVICTVFLIQIAHHW